MKQNFKEVAGVMAHICNLSIWEGEAKKDCCEYKASLNYISKWKDSLSYIVRSCFKTKQNNSKRREGEGYQQAL